MLPSFFLAFYGNGTYAAEGFASRCLQRSQLEPL